MAEKIIQKFSPVITEAALPYLRLQQGALDEITDPEAWAAAYCEGLHRNLAEIRHFLPETIGGVLDIGGGMGGIDALINHEYGGTLDVVIVDGDRDPPKVREKTKTYSNCAAAFEFLCANGVLHPKFLVAPDKPAREFDKVFLSMIEPVDLVLGVQSWGFHFAPSVHMPLAYAFSKPGTIWVLDVREHEGRSPWTAELASEERLEPIGRIDGRTGKYSRQAYRVIS